MTYQHLVNKSNGRVQFVYTGPMPQKAGDETTVICSDANYDGTHFWDFTSESWIEIPCSPTEHHTFNYDTKNFDEPNLSNYKGLKTLVVNKIASETILSRYPIHKQLNTLSEGGDINGMRDWIGQVRSLSNMANDSIAGAVNMKAVDDTFEWFRSAAASLCLAK